MVNSSNKDINKRLMSCATLDEFMDILDSEVSASSNDSVLVLTEEEHEIMDEFYSAG